MTAPFDWAGLAGSVVLANAGQGPDAAIAILQREIEAAFVPVEQRDKAEALLCQRTNEYIEATARAEAAEAEVRRLDYSTTHTCWDECPRLPCAQRREIEVLTAQLTEARESERAAAERHEGLVRALDAEAVAKDVARAAALSDLIAECAVLLDGGK